MTASRTLKTPTMSVPLKSSVSDKDAVKLTRYFTRLTLSELISSRDGISVRESLQQSANGSWERAYVVTLKLQRVERIREAFGLNLEDIAAVVTSTFIPSLSRIMNMELKRAGTDDGSSISKVLGGEKSEFIPSIKSKDMDMNGDQLDEDDDDGDDNDGTGAEDGVSASKFGRKVEMDSYGEMDEEDKTIQKSLFEDDDEPPAITDDDEATTDANQKKSRKTSKVSSSNDAMNAVRIDRKRNCLILQALRVDPSARPLLMVGLVERAASKTLVRSRPAIECGYINEEDGRGRCLQTAGCNFEEIWKLRQVEHNKLMSNDIWAVRCAYGVEAARMSIVEQIRGVFAVYGIEVDPRHLTLIADYMTYDGGYKAMNRIGMADASSSFLQMSYETTATFMIDAALNNRDEPMNSPSANIVLGRPIKHGTGAFECIVKA